MKRRSERRKQRERARSGRRRQELQQSGLTERQEFAVIDRRISAEEARERLQAGIEALRSRGVAVASNSRFRHYEAMLNDNPQTPPLTSFEEYARARIEAEQLWTIVHSCSLAPELQGWTELVSRVVNGTVHPVATSGPDPARDFEAELYAAALIRRAGFNVRIREPDLIAEVAGTSLGLAVKRPRSVSSAERAIKKGIDQIVDQSLNGAIWLDMTMAFDLAHGFWPTEHSRLQEPSFAADQVGNVVRRRIHEAVNSGLRRRVDDPRIVGVVVVAHSLLCDPATGRTVVPHILEFIPMAGSSRTGRLALQSLARGLGSMAFS